MNVAIMLLFFYCKVGFCVQIVICIPDCNWHLMPVIFLFRFGVGLITAVVLSSKRLYRLWRRKMGIFKSTLTCKRIFCFFDSVYYTVYLSCEISQSAAIPSWLSVPWVSVFCVLTLKTTVLYQRTTCRRLSSSVLDTISMNQYALFVFFYSVQLKDKSSYVIWCPQQKQTKK